MQEAMDRRGLHEDDYGDVIHTYIIYIKFSSKIILCVV